MKSCRCDLCFHKGDVFDFASSNITISTDRRVLYIQSDYILLVVTVNCMSHVNRVFTTGHLEKRKCGQDNEDENEK